jgi:uncharacterized protein
MFSSFIALALATAAAPDSDARTLSVTGDAEVRVVPDEVCLTVGVEVFDKVLSVAKKANDDRVKRVIAAAKARSISDKLIATGNVGIGPRYDPSSYGQVLQGYDVTRSLEITVHDLSKFDDLLTAVLDAGANSVQNVQFKTVEVRKHYDAARILAVRAAREKAELMAKELGQKVGRVRSIVEASSASGSRGNYGAESAIQSSGGDVEGATAPGTIGIDASVQIVFDLE